MKTSPSTSLVTGSKQQIYYFYWPALKNEEIHEGKLWKSVHPHTLLRTAYFCVVANPDDSSIPTADGKTQVSQQYQSVSSHA